MNETLYRKGKDINMNIKVNLLRILAIVCCLILGAGSPAFGQSFNDLKEVPPPAEELNEADIQTIIPSLQTTGSTAADENYILGATDIVEISVMRHPEVSGVYEINSEGKIQYEFVGDVYVNEMTKKQVAGLITNRLKEYIVDPQVTVKVTGYNSKVVYVVGEVYRPGKIFMRGNTITVREALMQAGLPMLTGVTKKSRLITPSESGKGEKRRVDVYALLYEGDLRENYVMNPGDVLYIPPTFLTKTMRALLPVTEPIGNAAGTAGTITTGF